MNQIIDKFGIDWKIFSAEIVNILALIAILSYFLYKKIFIIIEERQKKIDEGLTRAEEGEKILEEAEEKKKEILKEANRELSEKIEKGVELGNKKKEDIISKAKQEAEKILNNARNNAKEEKEQIISSSKNEISKMVVLGVEKILRKIIFLLFFFIYKKC